MKKVLLVLAIVGMFIMPMTPLKAVVEENNIIDLEQLYSIYNITENDLKFARGELPHYLEGTILDGKTVVMGEIIPDGENYKILDWEDPPLHEMLKREGYTIIGYEEWCEIEKNAIERYIKKFGVNPTNPKIDIVNGELLPSEYVREMVKEGLFLPGEDLAFTTLKISQAVGPWARFGKLYFYIFEAKDSYNFEK